MKRLFLFAFLSLGLARAGEQTAEEFRGSVSVEVGYRYLLSLPDGYQGDVTRKWPLVVFLHGAGERGSDLEMLKKHGPPKLIAAGQKFDAIIASLQCPSGEIWNSHGVKALTDDLIKKHRVDGDRVYLTGLSMGGFGTWDTAFDYPQTYAAIVPICGGAGVRWLIADRLKHLPIWIFHGAKDPVVEPALSQKMYHALKNSGSDVKLTLYPDLMHDSWTAAYGDPALWEWLFQQKL
jgi:predicted peptidase